MDDRYYGGSLSCSSDGLKFVIGLPATSGTDLNGNTFTGKIRVFEGQLKFCSCDNGVGANGTDCPVHGDAKCTRCDVGYRLDNSQCTPNQCSCNNGVGATGTECPTHGDAKCTSCDDGYLSLIHI